MEFWIQALDASFTCICASRGRPNNSSFNNSGWRCWDCLSLAEELNQLRASDYGLMKIDDTRRFIHFAEKPKGDALKAMQIDTSLLGLSQQDALRNPYIASMGFYVFRTYVLLKLLRWKYPSCNDFGSEIIPSTVRDYNVQECSVQHSIVGVRSCLDYGVELEACPRCVQALKKKEDLVDTCQVHVGANSCPTHVNLWPSGKCPCFLGYHDDGC